MTNEQRPLVSFRRYSNSLDSLDETMKNIVESMEAIDRNMVTYIQ